MKNVLTFFVKYPIWGNILVFILMVAGLLGLLSMNSNFFPELEPRNVSIQVMYPGASPHEMEEGVTLKVEEALKGIPGVEQITSVSSENFVNITVEGKKGYNQESVFNDVRNAVDKINSFPASAEKPVVFRVKPLEKVATIILQGDEDLMVLKKNAEAIETELLLSGKVSQVSLVGVPKREIAIEVSENNLRRYNLKFDDVAAAIRKSNVDISAGALRSQEEEMLIRLRNKKSDAHSISMVVVRTLPNGATVHVGDIAAIHEQFEEVPQKSYFNGKRAISIDVSKTPEEDMLGIADYVRKYIDEYNARNPVMQLSMGADRSTLVRQRIQLLTSNGVTGLILVVVSLGLFLNLRLSFWVAFGIPVAFLGMFFVGAMYGITINVISLFGMILVIGILVDDGIVISENIYAHFERGKTPYRAAIDGTTEVVSSVFASVLTTVVMFLPFFFLDGRMGEAFHEMALVVIACLVISLLEGFFVLPSHLAHSKALSRNEKKSNTRLKIEKGIDFIRLNVYGKLLTKAIKYKYVVLSLAIFFILFVIGLMKGGLIKTTFFPFVDADDIVVDVQLKPGLRETKTQEVLEYIEQKVWEVNKTLSANREDSSQVVLSTRLDIGIGGSEKGSIRVELMDGETRNLESFKISAALREKVGDLPDVEKITFAGRSIFGKPIAVSIMSKDLNELYAAKKDFEDELKSFPSLKDVTDNDNPGKREIQLVLKPLAYSLGLAPQDITRQIRQGFFGEEVQRLQVGKDEIRVWLRYPIQERVHIGNLESVRIKVADKEFPLTELVEYSIERGVVSINHYNGAREIKVEADLADPNEPVPPIIDRIKTELVPALKKKYPSLSFEFSGQDKENQKFGKSAGKSFPIAIGLLILILVLTFRSWSQMILIVLLIPLAVYGAFLGHGIEMKPVSIFSFYGIIALIGVVVNDSVVFMDKFNTNIREGLTLDKAMFDAGISRFRAIILTSLTTVAGLYPLILEKSRQAQFLIPLAISMAWGLVFATIFTLLVFPSLILIFNDIRIWYFRVIKGEVGITPEQAEPAYREMNKVEQLNEDKDDE